MATLKCSNIRERSKDEPRHMQPVTPDHGTGSALKGVLQITTSILRIIRRCTWASPRRSLPCQRWASHRPRSSPGHRCPRHLRHFRVSSHAALACTTPFAGLHGRRVFCRGWVRKGMAGAAAHPVWAHAGQAQTRVRVRPAPASPPLHAPSPAGTALAPRQDAAFGTVIAGVDGDADVPVSGDVVVVHGEARRCGGAVEGRSVDTGEGRREVVQRDECEQHCEPEMALGAGLQKGSQFTRRANDWMLTTVVKKFQVDWFSSSASVHRAETEAN